MKIAVLDDYFDTLRTLDCFDQLAGHDVAIWTEHVQDDGTLAERLMNDRSTGRPSARESGNSRVRRNFLATTRNVE